MAKCEIQGFDEILEKLEDLGDVDEIANEILFECGNILKDDMKAAINSAADRGYSTGELAESIVPTAPKKNDIGHFVAVRPVGSDSKGVSNGAKLQFLEHGTSKQQPRPTLAKVASTSEGKISQRAQEIFNKHVNL